jgi:hypothetical protein
MFRASFAAYPTPAITTTAVGTSLASKLWTVPGIRSYCAANMQKCHIRLEVGNVRWPQAMAERR